jgi:hypothetical protein
LANELALKTEIIFPDLFDLMRYKLLYDRFRNGESIEEIAKKDGITEVRVKQSIETVEVYEKMLSEELLRKQQIALIYSLAKKEFDVTMERLEAMKEGRAVDGSLIPHLTVPDQEMRDKTSRTITDRMRVVLPQGGGGVNIQQNFRGAAGTGIGLTDVVTFEDRIRSIQARRQEQLAITAAAESIEDESLELETLPPESSDEDATPSTPRPASFGSD